MCCFLIDWPNRTWLQRGKPWSVRFGSKEQPRPTAVSPCSAGLDVSSYFRTRRTGAAATFWLPLRSTSRWHNTIGASAGTIASSPRRRSRGAIFDWVGFLAGMASSEFFISSTDMACQDSSPPHRGCLVPSILQILICGKFDHIMLVQKAEDVGGFAGNSQACPTEFIIRGSRFARHFRRVAIPRVHFLTAQEWQSVDADDRTTRGHFRDALDYRGRFPDWQRLHPALRPRVGEGALPDSQCRSRGSRRVGGVYARAIVSMRIQHVIAYDRLRDTGSLLYRGSRRSRA